mmetsp:Transcript_13642/g.34564  ORF Transcript_13642/g.34564 Transcript_13642/m.34564 type:complete len:300 (-) Transcript_13642:214-1113(-)
MPRPEGAVVVGNGHNVVQRGLSLGRRDVLREVEGQGGGQGRGDLPELKGAHVELEALEVQHQHRRQLPEADVLPSVDLAVALRAQPALVASEHFLLEVLGDGVAQARHRPLHGDREIQKGFESSARKPTDLASQRVPQLALKQVHKKGLATLQVAQPCEGSHELLTPAGHELLVVPGPRLCLLGRLLGVHEIEVLVQSVEEEREELLDILLLVALKEKWCLATEQGVEISGFVRPLDLLPEIANQPCECLSELTWRPRLLGHAATAAATAAVGACPSSSSGSSNLTSVLAGQEVHHQGL